MSPISCAGRLLAIGRAIWFGGGCHVASILRIARHANGHRPCSTHKHDCQACTIVVVSIIAAALACGSGNKAWLDAISRTWGLFYGRLTRVEAQWQRRDGSPISQLQRAVVKALQSRSR
jgi:hypothetical protein